MFEDAVNDPTLWEGYEDWLDNEMLEEQAAYFFHVIAVGE